MKKFGVAFLIAALIPLLASGCSSGFRGVFGKRSTGYHAPPPRFADDERACLASGVVRSSNFVTTRSSLGSGYSGCGAIQPFVVRAAVGGRVALRPAATLRCPMVPAVEDWLRDVVRPAARQHLGREVVSIQVAASYACRTRNSIPGARLSEHGRANALDVRGFVLAGGEVVSVRHGWHSWGGESAFLREVHRGACRIFTTVLGPNADRYHRDHFHFDLARHGRRGTYRVCR